MRAIVPIVLRVVCLLILIIALSCVIVGKKVCVSAKGQGVPAKYNKEDCSYHISVSNWKHDSKLKGQYFVLVFTIILILLTIVLLAIGALKESLPPSIVAIYRMIVMGVCAFAALIVFISFCLEIWYATGYGTAGKNKPIKGITSKAYVQSYAAAAFFYGVLTILYIIDCVTSGVLAV